MLLHLPHPMYVLHRKTVTTNTQNTTVKITKPIHPGVLEGSKKWEGKLHREKKKCSQSVQAQELANARNGWKTLALSDLGWWFKKKKSTYWIQEDSALCVPETNIPIHQREGNMRRALGSGSCLPWQGVENRVKSCHILHPIPPILFGQQDSVAGNSFLSGRRRMWRRELLCRGGAAQG